MLLVSHEQRQSSLAEWLELHFVNYPLSVLVAELDPIVGHAALFGQQPHDFIRTARRAYPVHVLEFDKVSELELASHHGASAQYAARRLPVGACRSAGLTLDRGQSCEESPVRGLGKGNTNERRAPRSGAL